MTDREERQRVIEILQKEKKTALHDNKWAFDYAINSIKTDLKYDLPYEETSEQADKPTTKNDVPDINVGNIDCISREQAKAAIRVKFKDLPSRVEINTILNELPPATPQSILDKITEIIEPLRHLSFDEMSDIEWQILRVIDKNKAGTEDT